MNVKRIKSKLKLIILFILIPLFNSGELNAQGHHINTGLYYNLRDETINLNDSSFICFNSSDTLAFCSYIILDNNYIELFSPDPYKEALKGYAIKQNSTLIDSDSVRLCFNLPNYDSSTDSLIITISFGENYYSTFSSFKLSYSNNSNSIRIGRPFSIHNCYISIYQDFSNEIYKDDMYGSYYGIRNIDNLLELKLNGYNDNYEIYLPAISKSFFKRYYIDGEIVHLFNDTIKWRGKYWTKKTNNNYSYNDSHYSKKQNSKRLSGIYHIKGNTLESIHLSDSLFVYLWGIDTIAECHLVRNDNIFMEIYSSPPQTKARINSSIKNMKGNIDNKYIRFTFHIPNCQSPSLLIKLSFADSTDFLEYEHTFHYSQDNKTLFLLKDKLSNSFPKLCKISISLSEEEESYQDFYGTSYGIRHINNLIEFSLNSYKDDYVINLPSISEDLFNRYYIAGDYLLFKNNRIRWRGKFWKKTAH